MPVNLGGKRAVDEWRAVTLSLWPARCQLCGAASGSAEEICAPCRGELPRNACACARCGAMLPRPEPACGSCLRRPPPFERAQVPFRYAWPVSALLQRYKFAADLAAGRLLAALVDEALTLPAAPLLVPMPLHRERLRERGFDQAYELARLIARRRGFELAGEALARVRPTAAQSGLDALARRRNVRNAFVATARVAAREVVLVDDVVTTGATVRAAARALRRAGAARVEVVAVARA